MTEDGYVRYRPAPGFHRVSVAERRRLEAMTEEDIEAAALSDPDNPPLTEDRLQRLRPVPLAKVTRYRTGLTQQAFADAFGFSVGRLRDLEQGRTEPDSAIAAYLRLIRANPDEVRRMLGAIRPAA